MAGDPTHPGFTSRTVLSGNRSEKTLELGPPLTMQQDDKHACLTVCSLVPLCARTRPPRASNQETTKPGETALVDGTPKRNQNQSVKPTWAGSAAVPCKPVICGRPLGWALLVRHKDQTTQLRPLGWALLMRLQGCKPVS